MTRKILTAALVTAALSGCASVYPPALPDSQAQFESLVEGWAGPGRDLAASRTTLHERGFECRDIALNTLYCEHYRASPSGGRLPVVHGIEITSRDGKVLSNEASISRVRRLR